MRVALLLLAMVVGCSSEPTTDTGGYPPDAGLDAEHAVDASASSSSSGMSCVPIVWSYGPDRFCEECVCPGTECKMQSLGEDMVNIGTCGDDLECSVPCTDPLWAEHQKCKSVRHDFDDGTYCDACACPGMPCEVQNHDGSHFAGTCGQDLSCSAKCTHLAWDAGAQ